MNASEDFEAGVRRVLASLGPGQVATYGEVAEEAGFPGAARAVGNLLARAGDGLPWWRVIRADGTLAASNPVRQARLLRAEGVPVHDERVLRGGPFDAP